MVDKKRNFGEFEIEGPHSSGWYTIWRHDRYQGVFPTYDSTVKWIKNELEHDIDYYKELLNKIDDLEEMK